ncbi:MAG TPA: energy transducer TonB, partial [Flavobacteriaceae bacterium]|nr:energy transducer TonB [Flavobacteriaceae bacterium]
MSFIETKHEKKSLAITVIIHVALILLLLFFGFTYLDPPPENGIAVNFGTSSVGQGDVQPTEPVKSAPKNTSQPTPPEPQQKTPEIKEEVVTQDNSDAPVIDKTEDKKEVKK